MNLKRWWQRYNPRRKYIECEDGFISLMSQLGYVELWRGEYFFTDTGYEALKAGIKAFKEDKRVS